MRRLLMLLVSLLLAACGTVDPADEDQLVIEAFFDTGKPLPDIIVRRTLPLSKPYGYDSSSAVSDATVRLMIDGTQSVTYRLVNPQVDVIRPYPYRKRSEKAPGSSWK